MNKNRLLIELIAPAELKEMQKKINQWMTTNLLVKYKTSIISGAILFEIVLRKEP